MNSFISPREKHLTERFLRDGYIIQRSESIDALLSIRESVLQVVYEHLKIARTMDDYPLDDQHHFPIPADELNALKLRVMAALNSSEWMKGAYYRLARDLLHSLIGNELAMQRKFNINIQLPGDGKSLLPVHSDTWTGDSPYQLVLWVPLVDCYRTKSMYILPPGHDFTLEGSHEDVYQRIKDRVQFLDVKFGEVLLFNSTLPHGNRVNEEQTTRWTINCRFKSVWSPYAVKGPGEHFEPITLRAASRIGMAYKHPAL